MFNPDPSVPGHVLSGKRLVETGRGNRAIAPPNLSSSAADGHHDPLVPPAAAAQDARMLVCVPLSMCVICNLSPVPAVLFTFDTTHHALWAEEVARERGIPAEVVPAPAAAHARCNLALETLPGDADRLRDALADEGVPFSLYSAS